MFIPFFTWPRAKVKVHKYTYYLLLWSDFSSCLLWVSPLGVLALPLGQKILSHRFFWTLKWRDLHFLLASLLQPTFCLLTLKKFSPLTQPLRHWGLPDYLMVKTGSSAQLPLWICAFHYFYYKYFFNFANTTSDEFLNIYIYLVILCQGFLWIFHETCCQNTCLLDLNICTWISQGSSKIPLISFPHKPTLPPIFFISNRHNSSHGILMTFRSHYTALYFHHIIISIFTTYISWANLHSTYH